MKSRSILIYCSFCKSFGMSRGILVRESEFFLISSLSVQKPLSQERLVVSCCHCGVVFFAPKAKPFIHIKRSESIHADDFLSIGLRRASKYDLYRQMIKDFERIFVNLEDDVDGLHISNTTVVEVGSGIGSLTAALAARGNHVISIEPSTEDLNFQRDIQQNDFSRIEYHRSVAAAKSTSHALSVKLIFAWQVIEHLEKPLVTLAEIRDTFPNAEYFIGSVPALHPRNISEHHDFLLQEYTVVKWLKAAGFEVIYISYVGVLGFINFVAQASDHILPINSAYPRRKPYQLDELLMLQLFRGGIDCGVLQGCIDDLSYRIKVSCSHDELAQESTQA
jgi:hypothetical protein